MKMSEQIDQLAGALAAAQGDIVGAKKSSDNQFFKSKYADLSDIWDACRGPLSRNGLSVVQIPQRGEQGVILETVLLHSSGQWISGEAYQELGSQPLKDKYGNMILKDGEPVMSEIWKDPQKAAAAITYMRKSGLASFAGIPQVDDEDGNSITSGAHRSNNNNGTHSNTGDTRNNNQRVLPIYPGGEFSANIDNWRKLFSNGKRTAQDIINAVSTQFSLTPAQKEAIIAAEKSATGGR